MRDSPSMVGEQHRIVRRFQNVACRFRARLIGSPSDPLDAGYLSILSQSRNRIGSAARLPGNPAAAMVRWPPGTLSEYGATSLHHPSHRTELYLPEDGPPDRAVHL